MTLMLPTETERLIAEQVRSGRYATAEAVVAAAVADLARGAGVADGEADGAAVWDESLDAEDLAAIAEADAEAERGEGIMDLETFRAEMARWAAEPR